MVGLDWPKCVRNGVVFLIGGWLSVYGFMLAFTYYYGPVFSKKIILQTLILGVGLSYFVIRGRNWARVISLFGNFVPILLGLTYLAYVHLFYAIELNWIISMISLLVVLFFGLSIFYLSRPQSKTHFQLSSGSDNDSVPEGETK